LSVSLIGRTLSSQKLSQRFRLAEAGFMKASRRSLLKQKDCGRIDRAATRLIDARERRGRSRQMLAGARR